jgi:hypothetical protein
MVFVFLTNVAQMNSWKQLDIVPNASKVHIQLLMVHFTTKVASQKTVQNTNMLLLTVNVKVMSVKQKMDI